MKKIITIFILAFIFMFGSNYELNIANASTNESINETPNESIDESVNELPSISLEEYLNQELMDRNTNIDLSAFEESSDLDAVFYAVYQVMTQNPLVLDDKSFNYSTKTKMLIMRYSSASKESIIKQQNEIKKKVKTIISKIIKPNMTLEQKEKAIHDWIIDNGTYKDSILEEYNKTKDIKALVEKYQWAYNPYGILIKGEGVCQSYAEVFKLLADEAGVPAIVVIGTMNDGPHAWNMVKMDDNKWYHVDVTINDGTPYAVYNTPDKYVPGYKINETYLPKDILNLKGTSTKYDYYAKNSMMADNLKDLKDLLKKNLAKKKSFAIKINPNITNKQAFDLLLNTYKEVAPKLRFSYGRGASNVLVVTVK